MTLHGLVLLSILFLPNSAFGGKAIKEKPPSAGETTTTDAQSVKGLTGDKLVSKVMAFHAEKKRQDWRLLGEDSYAAVKGKVKEAYQHFSRELEEYGKGKGGARQLVETAKQYLQEAYGRLLFSIDAEKLANHINKIAESIQRLIEKEESKRRGRRRKRQDRQEELEQRKEMYFDIMDIMGEDELKEFTEQEFYKKFKSRERRLSPENLVDDPALRETVNKGRANLKRAYEFLERYFLVDMILREKDDPAKMYGYLSTAQMDQELRTRPEVFAEKYGKRLGLVDPEHFADDPDWEVKAGEAKKLLRDTYTKVAVQGQGLLRNPSVSQNQQQNPQGMPPNPQNAAGDRATNCREHIHQCFENMYAASMAVYCASTCGNLGKDGRDTGDSGQCRQLAQQGYCQNAATQRAMNAFCAESCRTNG